MNEDDRVFIDTVKSKGTLRTVKHVVSKRKFEDEDIIVVKVRRADTQYEEDIAHLVVEDEHPDARGKKGRPLNVFILGDFPQKNIPFHEGEIIALGGGCISENEKGALELVFTNDKQNTILREDFGRYNKEGIFSEIAKFPVPRKRHFNETVKTIKEIKEWVGCGLIAEEPKEQTVNEASSKTATCFNLVCKVLDVREIVPCLGIITVTDGSICRRPFLTLNSDNEVEFVSLDEDNFSVDIIVTLKTDALKNLKKGSYVKLFEIQGKRFPLQLSDHNDCIIFKINGRYLSFEPVVGNEREQLSNILHKRNQHHTTAHVSHNIADDSTEHLPISSPSNESFTILASCPQHNANHSNVEVDDDSQSILRHRVPPSKLRDTGKQSKFAGEAQKSHHITHKQHPRYGEKRGPNREERTQVETDDDDDDDDLGSRHQGEVSTSFRADSSDRHKAEHLGAGETVCGSSDRINKHVNESCAEPMRRHGASASSTKEIAQCGPSASNQSREQPGPESNYGRTEHDPDTDEPCTDDELFTAEKLTGLRRLKYLPGVFHVSVWIKDVLPSLSGPPLDLIIARCFLCRREQSYTRVSRHQPHPEQQICFPCSSQGLPKFLELKFKFTLVLWDACEREIYVVVKGEEAEKFLKCSVFTYIRDEQIRQQVWNTLRKFKDRGCYRKFRHAQDLIDVDIGVTAKNGFKKYILLGGVLNDV